MRYLVLFFLLIPILGQSQNILIDGKFDDWEAIVPFEDAIDPDNGSDFRKVWIHSDQQFIYLSFELGQKMILQEDNELALYLDIDDNVSTGSNNAMFLGSDLIFEFGNKEGLLYVDGVTNFINHADFGYVSAPTVSSNRFEIAFRRDDFFYNNNIFSSPEIKVFLRDDSGRVDRVPDIGNIRHTLTDRSLIVSNYSFKKVAGSDIRVISFNVQRDAIFEAGRSDAFKRIIQALQPDIIAFQEIYDNTERDVRNLMQDIMPTAPTGETWTISKVLPDIIMVSKFELKGRLTLEGSTSGSAGNGVFVYDLPEFDTDLVFINCHLPCCQNNDTRQDEIDAIMGFVRDYKEGKTQFETKEDAPIIIVGDMNMVGFDEQLTTFIRGDIQDEGRFGNDFAPDWDGSDFEDALPYNTNYPTTFTWYNPNSRFNPGRLDLIFYSGSVLDLKNSFSLFTPTLEQDTLSTYGMISDDVLVASDHLPLVADFKINTLSSTENISLGVNDFQVSPNPISDDFSLKFELTKQQLVELSLFNHTGQLIEVLKNERLSSGYHNFSLTGKGLPAGLYFLNLKTEEGSVALKIVKE